MIYGTDENGQKTKIMTNHQNFNSLYKSQVGKSIIQAISAYCLEADLSGGPDEDGNYIDPNFLIGGGRKKYQATPKSERKRNLEDLAKGKETYEEKWAPCMFKIPSICHKETYHFKDKNGKPIIINGVPKTIDYSSDFSHPSSQERACAVVEYLERGRQALLNIDDIDKRYSQIKLNGVNDDGKTAAGFAITQNDNIKNNIDVDGITTFTSGEVDKSGYSDEMEKVKEQFEKECYSDKGEVIDQEVCKQYVSSNQEEQKKLVIEYALRLRAMEDKIETEVTDDESAKKFLQDAGYDKEIDQILKDNNGEVHKRIKEKFMVKRKALIESLNNQVDNKTIDEKDLKKSNQQAANGDPMKKPLNKVKEEIEHSTDDFAQVIHFSNIISGYFNVEGGNGKDQLNTRTMEAELGNVSGHALFDNKPDPSRSTANARDNSDKKLQAYIDSLNKQKANDKIEGSSSSEDETRTLEVEQINKILSY